MSTTDNLRRAARGKALVEKHAQLTGDALEDMKTGITDAVADLMHLAAFTAVDWADVTDLARMHFDAEQNGDE